MEEVVLHGHPARSATGLALHRPCGWVSIEVGGGGAMLGPASLSIWIRQQPPRWGPWAQGEARREDQVQ